MTEEKFTYVVARPWYPGDPNSTLSIYAYGSQVHSGTMADAKALLEHVRFSRRMEPGNLYSIYRVTFEKLEESVPTLTP